MSRQIIVVGDGTSHGGVVVSGSPTSSINGKPVARLGDMVDCPQKYPGGAPHGINPIVEGSSTYSIDGIAVALHGHHTACGCTLLGSLTASTSG
jgi:uncharacterized Zn-binding protein involved in type VI secretion